MALYDFQCKNCTTVFEMSKSISERDNTDVGECPNCLSKSFSRLLSAPILAYSVTTKGGYGQASDGWKSVLQRIDSRNPQSIMKQTSSIPF